VPSPTTTVRILGQLDELSNAAERHMQGSRQDRHCRRSTRDCLAQRRWSFGLWFGVGFHPDSAEDHCVSLCGYGTINWLAQQLLVEVPAAVDGTNRGYALFTWNSIGEPSLLAITHEAWLRQPTTVPKSHGADTITVLTDNQGKVIATARRNVKQPKGIVDVRPIALPGQFMNSTFPRA
jgi:hypothetical protein